MKAKRSISKMPVRAEMCSTCPFRDGVDEKYSDLRPMLTISALSEASRICHQTGTNNAFHARTGKPPVLCRGARDVQLRLFHSIGFIEEPTDEAWAAKRNELGV